MQDIYKIILLGNANVGKTTFIDLYINNYKYNSYIGTTIGINMRTKKYPPIGEDNERKIIIWDTAGQEKYRSLVSLHYRDCHGVILMFDLNDRKSYDDIRFWMKEIYKYNDKKKIIFYIVGNKTDLERNVSYEEGEIISNCYEATYFECSMYNLTMVSKIFEQLIEEISTDSEIIPNQIPAQIPNNTTTYYESCSC